QPPGARGGREQPGSHGSARRGVARGWSGRGGHWLREARGRAASRRCAVAGTAWQLAARSGLAAIGAAAPGAMGAPAAALAAGSAGACRSAHGAGQWRGGKRARTTRERATAKGCHPVVEAGRARLEARTRGAGRARLSAGNRIGSQFARRLDPPRQLAAPGRAAGRGESVHRAGGGARRSVCSRALPPRRRAALQAAPENVDIGHSLAILRLRHGHFEEGWQGLELRRRKEYFVGRYRKFPFAEWQGEPLTGKTILVYPEQGLGDEIMYGSCIRELVARVRHVSIECDHKLGALFARSFPLCTVTARLRTLANVWVNE